MTTPTIDRADLQSLIVRGHGRLRAARFVLARIVDPGAASAWLAGVADDVAVGSQRPQQRAVNVALTPTGLRQLGVPADTVAMFSREFTTGMVTEHRSRILGDVDESAPEKWEWGGPGHEGIDVLLLLYAADEDDVQAMLRTHLAALETGGLRLVRTLDTSPLVAHEHFGFRDGVSQPAIEGLGEARPANTVEAGEFILGYPNAYGQLTPRPLVEPGADPQRVLPAAADDPGRGDLGRSGTYLVLRQLSQDVGAFWSYCDAATRRRDGRPDRDARVALASKMVGRWPSGAPLVRAPDRDRPDLGEVNDFGYHHEDRDGLRCPLGAHVRRSHPRDSLDPDPGSAESIAVGNRHRLLRRGRQYGPFLPGAQLLGENEPPPGDAEERGLHFICLAGNLSRQFEFVQHTWLNNPRFAGLYDTPDPLGSPAPPGGRTFTVPDTPVRRRYTHLPRFVTVRGGAYFFLPGVRALHYLAGLGGAEPAGSA